MTKDTLSLSIWSILLKGCVSLYHRIIVLLTLETQNCLEICLTDRKKSTHLQAPLLSTAPITPVLHPNLDLTPLVLSQYLLSHSEEHLRRRIAANAELIDLIEAGEIAHKPRVSLKSDSFGPQDDFREVLESDLRSVRLSLEDVKVELGGIEALDGGEVKEGIPGLMTVRKRKKAKKDKTACLPEKYIKKRMQETEDITAWAMYAPPVPHPLHGSIIESFRPVSQVDIRPNLPYTVECNDLMPVPDMLNDFPPYDDPVNFELLPEPEVHPDLDPVWFETPVTAPPLPDLQLPSQEEISFQQVQVDNPDMKPASVFLKLLGLVQAGQIELRQLEPWAPLQVLPVSR